MNKRNPFFWATIGFGVGAVIASAGRIANPIDSLGGLIQAMIWYGVSSLIIKQKSKKVDFLNDSNNSSNPDSFDSDEKYSSAKICDSCENRVPFEFTKCFNCGGTIFSHKKVAAGEFVSKDSPDLLPETKVCPMCAEDVKFAAKKCRFCQHFFE